MPETPTFGRYAEIPYEQMSPEQQEGYRSLLETRGRLPGPNQIYVHKAKPILPLCLHEKPRRRVPSSRSSCRCGPFSLPI